MDCVVETLKDKFEMMLPVLDERGRRLWAGVEAHSLGRGGISRVAEATGLSRTTVRQGVKEILSGVATPAEGEVEAPGKRTRRLGGGRKRLTETAPAVVLRALCAGPATVRPRLRHACGRRVTGSARAR